MNTHSWLTALGILPFLAVFGQGSEIPSVSPSKMGKTLVPTLVPVILPDSNETTLVPHSTSILPSVAPSWTPSISISQNNATSFAPSNFPDPSASSNDTSISVSPSLSSQPTHWPSDAPVTTTALPTAVPPLVSRIHEIQGSIETSPLLGIRVLVSAVVIGDFQNTDTLDGFNLGGFFLQEEDEDADNNPFTSEGIFVSDTLVLPGVDVHMGDLVQVIGVVHENLGQTQIIAEDIAVLASNQSLPTPAFVTLLDRINDVMRNHSFNYEPNLEALEGMRVVFTETLTIVEQNMLDRFNEIKLVAGARPYQYTQLNPPTSNRTLLMQHEQEIGSRCITYDAWLDGFQPVYSTSTAKRMGDTITGLEGILSYDGAGNFTSRSTWRVRSPVLGKNTFVSANPRPLQPPSVFDVNSIDPSKFYLKISTTNLLNFFTTLNDGGGGRSGPNLSMPRGANNVEEYKRQLQKTVTAILALDSDIVGLVELENEFGGDHNGDGLFAVGALVDALNMASNGRATYAGIDPGVPYVGNDAIACAFIYKTNRVVPVGNASILDSSVHSLYRDSMNRPALAQSFKAINYPDSECMTLVVTHLKSKGSPCDDLGDPDLGDGAGNCNLVRLNATSAMITWIQDHPTGFICPYQAILGDLNSYAREEPILNLQTSGFTSVKGPLEYSFVFDGQIGTLDYIFVNPALLSILSSAIVWHINADESDALDYNLDFGRDPTIFDGSNPARSSDHSPLSIGVVLQPPFLNVLIHEIRGSDHDSPYNGQTVNVTAIVIGDFQFGDFNDLNDLGGFFIQEEDEDADGDPETSEGIFVRDEGMEVDVRLGDKVEVIGVVVVDPLGMVEINPVSVKVLSSRNGLPTPALVELSVINQTTLDATLQYVPDLRSFEGMLVVFPETLMIVDQSDLDKYNEIKLFAGKERPYHFTQLFDPDVQALDAYEQFIGMRRITYDDGTNRLNRLIGDLDGFGPVYSTINAKRLGDTIVGLNGVLMYGGAGDTDSDATWRVRSIIRGTNKFSAANFQPLAPDPVLSQSAVVGLKVAILNVQNFFTTTTMSGLKTGPSGLLDPRGAYDTFEYVRQLEKLVTGILSLDADVIGLSEIENEFDDRNGDGSVAIAALVDALNDRVGGNVYDWVYPGASFVGNDAVACALIYKWASVTTVGGSLFLNSSIDERYLDTKNRPAMAQSIVHIDYPDECLTLTVAHFKSRDSPCHDVGDFDEGDGQGDCNVVRLNATLSLIDWMSSDPTGNACPYQIIMGDLNAYAKEDPIKALQEAGYTSATLPTDYSYVSQGQRGTLGYIFVNDALQESALDGVSIWHINEDEADALDYKLDFGRDRTIFAGYIAARHSDRSPLLVGLALVKTTDMVPSTDAPSPSTSSGDDATTNATDSRPPPIATSALQTRAPSPTSDACSLSTILSLMMGTTVLSLLCMR